jgi:hypothetical protein
MGMVSLYFPKKILSEPRSLQFIIAGGIEHFLLSRK